MTTLPLPQLSTISSHVFSPDTTKLAIANAETVTIYNTKTYAVETTLNEHDKLVTAIDWCAAENKIVTCSQDRNAYVWTAEGNEWKPTLVLLRINRAATNVKWSPNGKKFAVASGARCISVCYFEAENDWWVSKQIKKPIRSTVLSIDWHPNNVLLAAGCADMTARVFSAWIKGIDEKPPASPWGDKLPFNTVCAEYKNSPGGWVVDIAFSPDGNAVAWVAQDSTLNVSYPASGAVYKVRTNLLPFTSLIWLSESSIIGAGYDCIPVSFQGDDKGGWKFDKKLDQGAKKSLTGSTAMDKFKQMDSRSQSNSAGADVELSSIHQNTITLLRHDGHGAFSSSGVDGKVVKWTV